MHNDNVYCYSSSGNQKHSTFFVTHSDVSLIKINLTLNPKSFVRGILSGTGWEILLTGNIC